MSITAKKTPPSELVSATQALPICVNSIVFPLLDFLGHKGSRLNGCHMAWKMHSITLDDWKLSFVAISDSKDLYSASSSSISTKRFIEQTLSPYTSKKARQKMAWKTHFLAEGIIEKLPGKVLSQGVLTDITNNSFLCLLVPADWDNIWIHILEMHMNSYVTNTRSSS